MPYILLYDKNWDCLRTSNIGLDMRIVALNIENYAIVILKWKNKPIVLFDNF